MRTNLQFSETMITTMCKLQAEANSVMSDEWLTSDNTTIRYYRAGYVEAVEAVIQHGYKWWKKEKKMVDALKMELIDMLHFTLSGVIRSNSQNLTHIYALHSAEYVAALNGANYQKLGVDPYLGEGILQDQKDADDTSNDLIDVLELFIVRTIVAKYPHVPSLYVAFEIMEMSVEEIFALYVAKNTLNKFRTANGAKEGTYKTRWFLGAEDNEFVFDFVRKKAVNGEVVEIQDIWDFMEETYSSFLLS